MLRMKYKLRVNQTVRARCERHPTYDPSTLGKDQLHDRCSTCKEILFLYEAKLSLEKAAKAFERRAEPWHAQAKPGRENAPTHRE